MLLTSTGLELTHGCLISLYSLFNILVRLFQFWLLKLLIFKRSMMFLFIFSQECVFKKMSDNTALRVFWTGALRIYNCDSCCSRWYFTFNGAECSSPAAIDGGVYMRYGSGSRLKDLHRVRHIEGVCEKIHKGTVRVGFWVGKCASHKSADANTGWPGESRMYVEEIPPPQA